MSLRLLLSATSYPADDADWKGLFIRRMVEALATSPRVFETYLRAREHMHKRSGDHLDAAMRHFNLALEWDSTYVPAMVGVGECFALMPSWGKMWPLDATPRARRALQRVLDIDPDNASALGALGLVLSTLEWDFEAGGRYLEHALQRDPSDASIHHFHALHFMTIGQFRAARAACEVALTLDPYMPVTRSLAAWTGYLAGEQGALQAMRTAVADYPDIAATHGYLAMIAGRAGAAGRRWRGCASSCIRAGSPPIPRGPLFPAMRPTSRVPERVTNYIVSAVRLVPQKSIRDTLVTQCKLPPR